MDLSYTTVALQFSRDFEISNLTKHDQDEYRISISLMQFFVARNDEGILLYSDATKKIFMFSVKKKNNNWDIKINNIQAQEIKEHPYFKKK